mmetsp:Transcript_64312/g.186434  ORF Transcript_64312/g.186434 Transcript_64312/m.186434 type:complete len:236 (+) Transcript_64312:1193-1900(+)
MLPLDDVKNLSLQRLPTGPPGCQSEACLRLRLAAALRDDVANLAIGLAAAVDAQDCGADRKALAQRARRRRRGLPRLLVQLEEAEQVFVTARLQAELSLALRVHIAGLRQTDLGDRHLPIVAAAAGAPVLVAHSHALCPQGVHQLGDVRLVLAGAVVQRPTIDAIDLARRVNRDHHASVLERVLDEGGARFERAPDLVFGRHRWPTRLQVHDEAVPAGGVLKDLDAAGEAPAQRV